MKIFFLINFFIFRPKKLGLKNFKRAYFTFRDLYLSYYNTTQDANGPPLGHYYLKGAFFYFKLNKNILGCEVSQDLSVSQSKFHIKLQIPTSEGMTDLILKCDMVKTTIH